MTLSTPFRDLRGRSWVPLWYWALGLVWPLGTAAYFWHSQHAYPRGDGAGYWLATVTLAEQASHGLLAAMRAMLLEREWRGIMTPALGLPFLWLSGGDLLLAIALKAVCIFGAFLSYNYLLFSELTSHRRAALWTVFVGTLPGLLTLGAGRGDLSEPAFLAALSAAFFHGVRFARTQSLRDTVGLGLWCGFAACNRPAETALALGVGGAVVLHSAFRSDRVGARDLIASVSLVACCALLLLLPVFRSGSSPFANAVGSSFIATLLLAIATVQGVRSLRLSQPLFAALGCATLLPLFWWLPHSAAIYYWVAYGQTVQLATVSGRGALGLPSIGWMVCRDLFTATLAVIALVIACLRWRAPQTRQSRDLRSASALMPAVTALVCVFVIATTVSPLSDPRFGLTATLAAAWLVFLLYNKSRILDTTVVAAVILQIVAALVVVAHDNSQRSMTGTASVAALLLPISDHHLALLQPHRDPDPQVRVFQAFHRRLPEGGRGRVALLPRVGPPQSELRVETLSLLARHNESGFIFEVPWCQVSAPAEHLLWRLRSYDYAFVGPVEGAPAPWWPLQSNVAGQLIQAWRAAKPLKALPVIDTVEVKQLDHDSRYLQVQPSPLPAWEVGAYNLCPPAPATRGNG